MSDNVPSPFPVPPPPPTPSYSSISNKNNMPMFNYGLIVVGTAVIVLIIYNLLIIKHCNSRRDMSDQFPTRRNNNNNNNSFIEVVVTTGNSGEGIRSFENNNYYAAAASQRNHHLLSSFKYKKASSSSTSKEGTFAFVDGGGVGGGDSEECPVCLSVFEEGEEVRKLPRCKHSFHALCIDMWLYSHFDCPVCRTIVGPFNRPFPANENSHSGGNEGDGGGSDSISA